MNRVFYKYSEAKHRIRNSDLFLLQSRSLVAKADRSDWSHAAKAGWWYPTSSCERQHARLMLLEVREWYGGRAVTLKSQVRKYPGRIDVFEANAGGLYEYDREAALLYMIALTGCRYGWWNITRASLGHLAGIRLAASANTDELERDKYPPFCSQAVIQADVVGGVRPVRNRPSRLVLPGELAHSQFYGNGYRFTLVPDDYKLAS